MWNCSVGSQIESYHSTNLIILLGLYSEIVIENENEYLRAYTVL
jgi:hypothetical protein